MLENCIKLVISIFARDVGGDIKDEAHDKFLFEKNRKYNYGSGRKEKEEKEKEEKEKEEITTVLSKLLCKIYLQL